MLLSYFTPNSTSPHKLTSTDFGVDIFPTTQTKLSTLSLASNFGVWSSSEQTEQAKKNAHVMEKYFLHKVICVHFSKLLVYSY